MNNSDGYDDSADDRPHTHTHQCETCGADYGCGGPTERNHDGGGGDWICLSHYRGDVDCEACREAVRCDWCGVPIPTGGGKVIGGENEGIACDEACRRVLEADTWTPADATMAREKLAAWKDARAAERTRKREAAEIVALTARMVARFRELHGLDEPELKDEDAPI